jgi:hypothetical protein
VQQTPSPPTAITEENSMTNSNIAPRAARRNRVALGVRVGTAAGHDYDEALIAIAAFGDAAGAANVVNTSTFFARRRTRISSCLS